MSMLKKEIPMEIRKTIGGVIEFKRNTFVNDGVISLWIDLVLIAMDQIMANVEPVRVRITVYRMKTRWNDP
jgi:hypothetical protein